MTKTQDARILAYLRTGKALDPMTAMRRFGSFRLASRICTLRMAGHNIVTNRVNKGGKSWAAYRMA
jgi:hypothetical protein